MLSNSFNLICCGREVKAFSRDFLKSPLPLNFGDSGACPRYCNGKFHDNRVLMRQIFFDVVCQTKTNNCNVKQSIQLYLQGLFLTISTVYFTKTHLVEEQCRCNVW